MEVLSSRILLRPVDRDRSRRFYRDVLGLAVFREFGPADDPAVVFFLGQGLLEVSGHAPDLTGSSVRIWLQVRDVRAEHDRLMGQPGSALRASRCLSRGGWLRCGSRIPMASRSCWSKFPRITRCAATRDD